MRLRCEHEIPLPAEAFWADLPECVAALLRRIGVEGPLGYVEGSGAGARAARCAGG